MVQNFIEINLIIQLTQQEEQRDKNIVKEISVTF